MTEEQEEQLDALLEVESGLRDHELDFIENLDHNLRERLITLTDKQAGWLQSLYERFC
jgi:hypothetical protein